MVVVVEVSGSICFVRWLWWWVETMMMYGGYHDG